MERAKKTESTPVDTKIWWKKIGGGSLRLTLDGRARIIPPGGKFQAEEYEIPKAFRDMVIPQETISEKKEPLMKGINPSFFLSVREDGFCDILNSNGKKINQNGELSKEVAERLIQDLENQ
jgi:hypothetical protein